MLNHIPPGLRNLIILIGLVGMAQIALPNINIDPVQLYLFYPDSDAFRPWQLVTHMFAHGGFTHFLFNVIALISFGGIIEYKLGTRRFLTLYFISGLGAVLLHYISVGIEVYQLTETFFPNLNGKAENIVFGIQLGTKQVSYGPMLGASGAIYGIMAAFAFFYPNEEMVFLFIPYPIKAKYLVPIILAIDLIFGFTNLENDPFAHFAHLGGALAGFLTVSVWFKKWNRKHWR
jgi:rhomboid-like protein